MRFTWPDSGALEDGQRHKSRTRPSAPFPGRYYLPGQKGDVLGEEEGHKFIRGSVTECTGF